MRNKSVFKIIVIASLVLFSSPAYSLVSAVESVTKNAKINAVTQAVVGVYTTKQFIKCFKGWGTNAAACAKAAVGVATIYALRKQLSNNMPKIDQYSLNGNNAGGDLGLCLDPSSSGCTQGNLDTVIEGTEVGSQLKSGNLDGALKATKKIEDDLGPFISKLKEKGYNLNLEEGTFTGPDGKTQSLSSLSSQPGGSPLPSSVASALSDKIKALKSADGRSSNKAIAQNSRGQGVGSAGSGSASVKSALLPDLDNSLDKKRLDRGIASTNNNSKEKFLSSMSGKNSFGAVGVSGDNLFKMIQRRYNEKKKSKEFIFQ